MSEILHLHRPILKFWMRFSKVQQRPTPGVTQRVTYIINTRNPALRISRGIQNLRRTFICFVPETVSYQIPLSNHKRFCPLSSCYQIILNCTKGPDYLKTCLPGSDICQGEGTWNLATPCLSPGSNPSLVYFYIYKLLPRILLWQSIEASEMAKFRIHGKILSTKLPWSRSIAF